MVILMRNSQKKSLFYNLLNPFIWIVIPLPVHLKAFSKRTYKVGNSGNPQFYLTIQHPLWISYTWFVEWEFKAIFTWNLKNYIWSFTSNCVANIWVIHYIIVLLIGDYQVLFKYSSLQANIQKNNADKQKGGYILIMILWGLQ